MEKDPQKSVPTKDQGKTPLTAKSGTSAKGRPGPRLEIDLPVSTEKRSFTLKTPTVRLLADYAAYLSAHFGQEIDEARVLEALIAKVRHEKGFTAWLKESSRG